MKDEEEDADADLEFDLPPEVAELPPLQVDGPSDHELITRAQKGEEQAFETLVRRHEARAIRVARNMVPSDEDAQDLAQEAFLRVFRSLERFDFAHEFTTWLYRIVTNLAIDHLRKRRPQFSTTPLVDDEDREPEIVDPRGEQPSDAMEERERASEVQACLSALAPHFQSVLVLREFEDLACNEIAQIVGATHVTVRWRLHRGRKLFQEEWERRARLREKRAIELSAGSGGAPRGGPPGQGSRPRTNSDPDPA
jgi:RNA polymerase sigma-70 factor (ECF subfamily)